MFVIMFAMSPRYVSDKFWRKTDIYIRESRIVLFGLVSMRLSLGALRNNMSVPPFRGGRRHKSGIRLDKGDFCFEHIGVVLLCVVTVGVLNVV